MEKNYRIEACVETLEEAIAAEKKGADQIELCARLDLDGITPEWDLVKSCLQQLRIPVKVMIRPRPGNFEYNDAEWNEIMREIDICRHLGVEEIVIGVLKDDQVDTERMSELASWADPMRICFHKAIDEVVDPLEAVQQLKSIPQINSILTSGAADTAFSGIEIIRQMKLIAGPQLVIIGAGKITNENIQQLHDKLGLSTYHGRKILGTLP